LTKAVDALTASDTDEICIAAVVKTQTRRFEIRIHWVVDEQPWYIASLVAVGPSLARQCAAAGWHQWRQPWDLEWKPQPQRPQRIGNGERVLCAYRGTTPDSVVREVCLLIIHHLGAPQSRPPQLTVIPRPPVAAVSPAAPVRRADSMSTSRRPASRKPSVTSCDECGHPLSDPESIAVGMGPECRRRYLTRAMRNSRSNPDAARLSIAPGAISAKGWRLKMKTRLNAWISHSAATANTWDTGTGR
jgi:hypothetical protein